MSACSDLYRLGLDLNDIDLMTFRLLRSIRRANRDLMESFGGGS